MANPLKTLQEYGQSVWLDFVSRDLLKSGGLAKLIAEDGLRGAVIGMRTFGASAPLKELLVKFGFTGENVYAAAKQQLARQE